MSDLFQTFMKLFTDVIAFWIEVGGIGRGGITMCAIMLRLGGMLMGRVVELQDAGNATHLGLKASDEGLDRLLESRDPGRRKSIDVSQK